ncbi:MAG: IclR family transcriptional regulator C-terminal domain-containing protein, partial [Streptosporangiaceae bacterium]
AQRHAVLRQCLPEASADELDAVNRELRKVRELGWAVDDGLFQDGVCCIAAPFYRSDGSVAGSVAVSVPSTRFDGARESITDAVLRSARQASQIAGQDPAG